MIAYLKGKVAALNNLQLIIDVQGVGYAVGVSAQTLSAVPNIGEDVFINVYHHFTDSEQRLFGFLEKGEMELFEKLLKVKSVGPKLALGILSGMPYRELIQVISGSDVLSLSRVPGIGKKTAERIVLELADKLVISDDDGSVSPGSTRLGVQKEAISALESLGYRKSDAEKAVQAAKKELDESVADVSEWIKVALRLLYK